MTSFVIEKLWFCVLMRRRDNAGTLEIWYLLCVPENKLFTAYMETYRLFHEVRCKFIFIQISVQKGGQIYLHIQHYFDFFPPNVSLKIATHILCLSYLRLQGFITAGAAWKCFGEDFDSSLFPISPGPIAQSCVWLDYLSGASSNIISHHEEEAISIKSFFS